MVSLLDKKTRHVNFPRQCSRTCTCRPASRVLWCPISRHTAWVHISILLSFFFEGLELTFTLERRSGGIALIAGMAAWHRKIRCASTIPMFAQRLENTHTKHLAALMGRCKQTAVRVSARGRGGHGDLSNIIPRLPDPHPTLSTSPGYFSLPLISWLDPRKMKNVGETKVLASICVW